MKRVYLFLMVAGLTTMFVFGQKKEIRQVSGFTGINASGTFDVTVVKGSTESLTIEANEDTMPYVRSEVRNGVLYLYLDSPRRLKNVKTLKASVVMTNLDMVSLSGVCKLTANDLFTPDRFTGDCSGASQLTVNLNTGMLKIDMSGTSKIRLKAKVTKNAQLDISGASNLHGELEAADVNFNSSGTCSVELSGSATSIHIVTSGAANFTAGNFAVQTATITSAGTSKIIVNAVDALEINSSGASTVKYKGSPAIQMSISGVAKVESF